MESVKTILAIDDNQDILYTLEQICRFQGWKPLLAAGYREAEALLKKERIDLILVDYHMPGVDGITAVTEIRKKLPRTPIIVLTIEEEEQIVNGFMNAGADDYSLKPIKAIDLISRIKVHLQYHEKSQYYESCDKGISKVTLQKIECSMRERQEYSYGDMGRPRTLYRWK